MRAAFSLLASALRPLSRSSINKCNRCMSRFVESGKKTVESEILLETPIHNTSQVTIEEALKFYEKFRWIPLSYIDHLFTYNYDVFTEKFLREQIAFMIRGCGKIAVYDDPETRQKLCNRIWEKVIEWGDPKLEEIICCSRVKTCMENNYNFDHQMMFNDMKLKGIIFPNNEFYTNIFAYLCSKGELKRAEYMYRNLFLSVILPDDDHMHVLNSMIKLYLHKDVRDVEKAKEWFAKISTKGNYDKQMKNFCASDDEMEWYDSDFEDSDGYFGYDWDRDNREAAEDEDDEKKPAKVYANLSPNKRTYEVMLEGFCNINHFDNFMDTFNEAIEKFQTVSANSLMICYLNFVINKNEKAALKTLDLIPDFISFKDMVEVLRKLIEIKEFEFAHKLLSKRNVNEERISSFIELLLPVASCSEIIDHCKRLVSKGIDKLAFQYALKYYVENGNIENCFSIIEEMNKENVLENFHLYPLFCKLREMELNNYDDVFRLFKYVKKPVNYTLRNYLIPIMKEINTFDKFEVLLKALDSHPYNDVAGALVLYELIYGSPTKAADFSEESGFVLQNLDDLDSMITFLLSHPEAVEDVARIIRNTSKKYSDSSKKRCSQAIIRYYNGLSNSLDQQERMEKFVNALNKYGSAIHRNYSETLIEKCPNINADTKLVIKGLHAVEPRLVKPRIFVV